MHVTFFWLTRRELELGVTRENIAVSGIDESHGGVVPVVLFCISKFSQLSGPYRASGQY
jgi:hypothetical protein